jgi:polyadenylate-binding protein
MTESSNTNIYVKNIDYDITDKILFDCFSYIGEIRSLHIVRDPRGRSRGFGFLTFSSAEMALQAINEMNGKFLGRKRILVMLHIRKEDRRAMKRIVLGDGQIGYEGNSGGYDVGGGMKGMDRVNSQGMVFHHSVFLSL